MTDDPGHPAGSQGADEASDRRAVEVLEQEAALLHELAELLIRSGSISLERPTGTLTARLKPPGWWRQGELETRAVAPGRASSSRTPLSRVAYRDHAGLRSGINLQLAFQLAWLMNQE